MNTQRTSRRNRPNTRLFAKSADDISDTVVQTTLDDHFVHVKKSRKKNTDRRDENTACNTQTNAQIVEQGDAVFSEATELDAFENNLLSKHPKIRVQHSPKNTSVVTPQNLPNNNSHSLEENSPRTPPTQNVMNNGADPNLNHTRMDPNPTTSPPGQLLVLDGVYHDHQDDFNSSDRARGSQNLFPSSGRPSTQIHTGSADQNAPSVSNHAPKITSAHINTSSNCRADVIRLIQGADPETCQMIFDQLVNKMQGVSLNQHQSNPHNPAGSTRPTSNNPAGPSIARCPSRPVSFADGRNASSLRDGQRDQSAHGGFNKGYSSNGNNGKHANNEDSRNHAGASLANLNLPKKY